MIHKLKYIKQYFCFMKLYVLAFIGFIEYIFFGYQNSVNLKMYFERKYL